MFDTILTIKFGPNNPSLCRNNYDSPYIFKFLLQQSVTSYYISQKFSNSRSDIVILDWVVSHRYETYSNRILFSASFSDYT